MLRSIAYRPLAVALLTAICSVYAAAQDTYVFFDSAGRYTEVDPEDPGMFAEDEGAAAKQLLNTAIDFRVSYEDVQTRSGRGFDDPANGAARREVVGAALKYIDSILNETGRCDIKFERSETDGGGFLASGGTLWYPFAGFDNGFAFNHITSGFDRGIGVVDILITVDFGYRWNETTAAPAFNEFDLLSVLIHEFSHGIGLMSLAEPDGASSIGGGAFTYWDMFLETGNGADLWRDATGRFIGTPAELRGSDGGVVFTGPEAMAAYGGLPPVYAPGAWDYGGSLSHFDDRIPGRAVMEPFITQGDMLRTYAPVEIGALRDIGYVFAAAPGTGSGGGQPGGGMGCNAGKSAAEGTTALGDGGLLILAVLGATAAMARKGRSR